MDESDFGKKEGYSRSDIARILEEHHVDRQIEKVLERGGDKKYDIFSKENYRKDDIIWSDKSAKLKKTGLVNESELFYWGDDFVWKGEEFVFGEIGKIYFYSKNRKYIFNKLTDEKGMWVLVVVLKNLPIESKTYDFVRPTISQIEKRLPPGVSIVSTRDDKDCPQELKPDNNQGAYRIKFAQSCFKK